MSYPQISVEEMKIRRDFGARLMSAREEAGLTRIDLADLVGLNKDYIYRVENGMRNPLKPEYEKYKEVFSKSDNDFYPGGVPELMDDVDKVRSEARKNKKKINKSLPIAPEINIEKNVNKVEDVQEVEPMEQVKFVETKPDEVKKDNKDNEKREEAFLGEIRQVKKEYEDIIAKINKQFQDNFDSMREEYSRAIEKLRNENEKLKNDVLDKEEDKRKEYKKPVIEKDEDKYPVPVEQKAVIPVKSDGNKKMSLSIPFTEGRNIVLTIEEAI